MNKVDHREPFAMGRLLIRSALLGFFVPVSQSDLWTLLGFLAFGTQGELWDVKAVQVVSALVI